MKLLIAEDEQNVRKGVVTWLSKSGFEITEVKDGKQALEEYKVNHFDLVLLDIMMPELDGLEVLKRIREKDDEHVPVIMLTARSNENDIISALNSGADDYIIKPFSNRELEARINANLRKHKYVEQNYPITSLFEIDNQKYIITNDKKTAELTRKEIDLLNYLIAHEGELIKKSVLLENIWGNLDSTDTRTLDIHISKLRKKLEKIGICNVIITKRGLGYGFVSDNEK